MRAAPVQEHNIRRTSPAAWALARRLPEASRSAIVADYQSEARQQVLADRYEISLSSSSIIKRLLRAAGDA